jgi:hypothetical protein
MIEIFETLKKHNLIFIDEKKELELLEEKTRLTVLIGAYKSRISECEFEIANLTIQINDKQQKANQDIKDINECEFKLWCIEKSLELK